MPSLFGPQARTSRLILRLTFPPCRRPTSVRGQYSTWLRDAHAAIEQRRNSSFVPANAAHFLGGQIDVLRRAARTLPKCSSHPALLRSTFSLMLAVTEETWILHKCCRAVSRDRDRGQPADNLLREVVLEVAQAAVFCANGLLEESRRPEDDHPSPLNTACSLLGLLAVIFEGGAEIIRSVGGLHTVLSAMSVAAGDDSNPSLLHDACLSCTHILCIDREAAEEYSLTCPREVAMMEARAAMIAEREVRRHMVSTPSADVNPMLSGTIEIIQLIISQGGAGTCAPDGASCSGAASAYALPAGTGLAGAGLGCESTGGVSPSIIASRARQSPLPSRLHPPPSMAQWVSFSHHRRRSLTPPPTVPVAEYIADPSRGPGHFVFRQSGHSSAAPSQARSL